jgi:NTP pyrophosphatase (non-canonical NTP hydrolase)
MTPNEYQKLALRTEMTPDFVRGTLDDRMMARLLHALLGMCTETGEIQDMVKKHMMYGKEFDPINVIEECGDLLWYTALALDAVGYSLEDCMRRNIEKLCVRFSDRFTSEAALNRDLDAERKTLEQSGDDGAA